MLVAQPKSPEEVFGFRIGDDYKLADYSQMVDYHRQLADASDRVFLKEIGKSVLGRPMLLQFISTSENLRQLDRWKAISTKLARARISEEEAQKNATRGHGNLWAYHFRAPGVPGGLGGMNTTTHY